MSADLNAFLVGIMSTAFSAESEARELRDEVRKLQGVANDRLTHKICAPVIERVRAPEQSGPPRETGTLEQIADAWTNMDGDTKDKIFALCFVPDIPNPSEVDPPDERQLNAGFVRENWERISADQRLSALARNWHKMGATTKAAIRRIVAAAI